MRDKITEADMLRADLRKARAAWNIANSKLAFWTERLEAAEDECARLADKLGKLSDKEASG